MLEDSRPTPEQVAQDIELSVDGAISLRDSSEHSQKYLDNLQKNAGFLEPAMLNQNGKWIDTNEDFRKAVERKLQSDQQQDSSVPKFAISDDGVIYSVALDARMQYTGKITKPEIIQVIADKNKTQINELDGVRWPFDSF